MAVYPGARYRPITPGTNDPPIIVIGAILHVDAGNSKSLYGYFNGPSGGIESHFHVPKEYQVEQYRDTGYEADANLKANSFIKDGKRYGYVSIETQGFEAGTWNEYQLTEIKKLLQWLSKTHGFPLVRCPAHMSPGVGYHVMFGAPGPWAPNAKSCPGPDRVKQFTNVLVPWMKVASLTKPDPTTGETVALTDADVQKILNTEIGGTDYLGRPLTVAQSLREGDAAFKLIRVIGTSLAEGGELNEQLDRIEADLDAAGKA